MISACKIQIWRGCHSLNMMKSKIDKSLVDGISEDYKQNIFVIFSDALAKLNKTLVFEGVENETQYRFIANRYPDALIQGWYFSKALTRSELAKQLTGVTP